MTNSLRRFAVSSLAVLVAALSFVVWTGASPVSAAPLLTVTASSPGSVLAGDSIPFGIGVANDGDVIEYNVSVRATLPPDVVYDAGSTSPSEYGEPTVVVAAATGVTTLIWSNVADLQIGDSLDVSFTATPQTSLPPAVFTTYPVGATLSFGATGYANSDPRIVPRFDTNGEPITSSFTESGSATPPTTDITAIEIAKSEPSPESELLRGIHDHPTVYTLTVEVTDQAAVDDVVVTDMLPAQLEFLGCGGVDNSTGVEYPGAPPLTATPSVAPCVAPTSVSTVANPGPDGSTTYPPGVYTRVVWNLGNRPAGSVATIRYAAGIPLRANTTTFSGATPSPASLGQIANLDNNTGAPTREGAAESSITNRSRAAGTYTGVVQAPATPAVSDSTSQTVSIEDLRIRKSVSPGTFAAGGLATYTVIVDTSEYVSVSTPILTDTMSNGLCPLDDVDNHTGSGDPQCDTIATGPTVSDGVTTSALPYTSVVELPGGGFDTTFTSTASIPASSTLTVTYQARMRGAYENGPVDGQPTVAGDGFANTVDITADSTPVPATGQGSTVVTIGDSSGAGLVTPQQTIDKRVKPRVVGEACDANVGAYVDPTDPSLFRYRRGDDVCFRLTVNFAPAVFNKNPVVTDFLPPGVTYTDGSMVVLPTNDVDFAFNEAAAAADTANPTWQIGTPNGSDRFAGPSAVFDVVLAGTVNDAPSDGVVDLTGNLMKMVTYNTANQASSFRDEVPFEIVPAAPIELDKTVTSVDVPAFPGSPIPYVQQGSVSRFTIDLFHAGSASNGTDYSVRGLEVWDVLPQPLRCADVTTISNPLFATCFDSGAPGHPTFAGDATRSAIVWDFVVDPGSPDTDALFVGDTKSLFYDVTWPAVLGADTTYTNTAGLRSFEAFTNEPDVGTPYFPADNIDTDLPSSEWSAPRADDTADVFTRDVTVVKTATSPTEPGNNQTQAVIGEVVTYTYSAVIPARTTVYDAQLVDTLPSDWVVAASPAASLTFQPDALAPGTAAPPAGVALDPTTGTLSLGAEYSNDTDTDQRFNVIVNVLVTGTGVGQTAVNTNRDNTARFTAGTADGGPANAINRTAAQRINVRQPTPTLTKTNDAGGNVVGGQSVTYVLTASQPNNRPPLHDSWIVDCIPSGVTFTAFNASPYSTVGPTAGPIDGCPSGTTRIGWKVDSLIQNSSISVSYTATIDLSAVGGDVYTNTAVLSGSSLDDGDRITPSTPDNPLERVYTRSANSSVTVAGSTVTKLADRTEATIGETITYTVDSRIPQDTNFYQTALVDTLPTGVDPASVTLTSATCTIDGGGACPGVSGTLWPVAAAPGSDIVVFYGDLAAATSPRTLRAVYTARVADTAVNTSGHVLTNVARTEWDITDQADPTGLPYTWNRTSGTASRNVRVIQPDLTITKSVNDPDPALTDTFDYTVTVRNNGASDLSAAYNLVVTDTIPAGVVVDAGSISNGGSLSGNVITWDAADLPGPLAPNGVLTLTYSATFDLTRDGSGRLGIGPAPLVNTARNTSYESLPTGGRTYIGDSATASVTAEFPDVALTKAVLDAPPAYIGDAVAWQISGINNGTGTAQTVDVTDTLPTGWEYVAGSSSIVVGMAPPVVADPAVTGPVGARVLDWSVGAVTAGQAFTVTFRALPTASVVSDPGIGSTIDQVNASSAVVTDVSGATGNTTGTYDTASNDAVTRIDAVDVQITSTTPAVAIAGTNHDWTLTVTNNGADTAVGPFTVTDVLDPGVAYVGATGTGWSCSHDGSPTGGTVTCTRANANDTLAPSAGFPPVTVTVAIDADAMPGTTYTDDAEVSLRTFDTNPANNTDADTTTVTTSADLRVTKSHTGSGVAGTDLTWTVTIDNLGPSVSRGPIVTTDTLPAGVSFGGFVSVDPDLSCAEASGTITCTRVADMSPSVSDTFVFAGLIDPAQIADVTNTASVTGPTPDPVPGNNVDQDPVDVTTSADLAITKAVLGIVEAGSSGGYRITVTNLGDSDAGAFSFTDTLPAGVTVTGIAVNDAGATCAPLPATGTISCTYAAGIDVGQTHTIEFDVSVASDVTGTVTNRVDLNPGVTPDPNPANDTATVSTGAAIAADLGVVKTGPATATAGTEVAWQLRVTNNGPSDDPGPITVTDTLPEAATYVGVDDPSAEWSCVHDGAARGGVVTCTNAIGLVDAESQDLTITAFVNTDTGPATERNTASVMSPAPDSNGLNNTSFADLDIVDDVEIVVAKTTTGPNPVRAGETTDFDVVVTNSGPSTADGIVLTDVAPAGMTVIGFTAAGWSCTVATSTCTLPALDPGDAPTVNVQVVIAPNVADATTLTNVVNVSTTSPGDLPAGNVAVASVDVAAEADLGVVKSHDGSPVVAGDVTTFTFDVDNGGPSDAVAAVTLTDTLPVGTTFVSSSGSWNCVAGDPAAVGGQVVVCTYLVAGVPAPLPAGSSADLLVMQVRTSSTLLPTTLTNSAVVASPTTDPNSDNDVGTVDVDIVTQTNIAIAKTSDPDAVIGDTVTWQVVVSNLGPSDALDVVVTDSLPATVTDVAASGTGWTCTVLGDDVTCTLDDALAALADTEPITITALVSSAAYPTLSNTAIVATSTPEPDTSDNTSTVTTPVQPLADLTIDKSHAGTPQVGGQIEYSVVVGNNGPTENPGPITVTDELPAGLTPRAAAGTGWDCTITVQTVSCVRNTALGVDDTASLTITADVEPAAAPSVVNVASVTSPHTDPVVDNNVSTDPTTVVPLVRLALTKTLLSLDGSTATWELLAANLGPNDTTGPLVISDDLPPTLRYLSSSGAGWSCVVSGQLITCTNDAGLAVGETSTLQIVTTVIAPAGTTVTNSATLTGGGSEVGVQAGATVTVPTSSTGQIPTTGSDSGNTVNMATALLVFGAGLLVVSRRRRRAFG
jgi:large repetitive protein